MSDQFTSGLKPIGVQSALTENQRLMEAMDFSQIQELLGERTPSLIPGEVGRLRLMNALKSTFGESFRGNAAAREAISIFDRETEKAKEIIQLRGAMQNG